MLLTSLTAVVLGTFTGVTNTGLFADWKVKINTLKEEIPRIDSLERSVKNIESIVTDVTEILEDLSERQTNLQDTMDIFMFLGSNILYD